MNRSKIFLASTTALLAIVGVVSAKAHKAFSSLTFYTNKTVGCQHHLNLTGQTSSAASTVIIGYTGAGCQKKPVYAE